MADAVRVANDGFHGEQDRPKGGSYKNGYRYTGYFLAWIQQTKDPNFLRKFNRTAIELETWSWDAAIQKCLGNNTPSMRCGMNTKLRWATSNSNKQICFF